LRSPGCVSRVLARRRCLIWRDLAPCGGLRRARKFLPPARPTLGPRRSKFLAKTLELWPYDAASWCDADARRRKRRCDAASLLERRPVGTLLAASSFATISASQRWCGACAGLLP